MEGENPQSNAPQSTGKPARIYVLKPFTKADGSSSMNLGPGRSSAPAPPASALIHLKKNNGIDSVPTEEKSDAETRAAVSSMIMGLPNGLRKKMYALQSRIEAMARLFGLDDIGMQTLTIRENVTDGREFNKRFKSISTNIFPKLYQAWIRVYERQQRGAWHVHVIVATKADIRGGSDPALLSKLLQDKRDRKINKALYYAGSQRENSSIFRWNGWLEKKSAALTLFCVLEYSEIHRLAKQKMIRLKSLAVEPFVQFHRQGAPGLFDEVIGCCRRAGFSPRIVNEPNFMATVMTLVESGLGVSLIPHCVRTLNRPHVVIRPIMPKSEPISLCAAWLKSSNSVRIISSPEPIFFLP